MKISKLLDLRYFAIITIIFWSVTILAEEEGCVHCECAGAIEYGPIGVMGEHVHPKGESMVSYRAMFMNMDGNRSGTNRESNSDVLSDFMVTPTEMDMRMHMFGFMYAPTDNLTVMAMVPYTELSMNHLTRNGNRFKTTASGLGDIKLSGLWSIFRNHSHRLHLNTGVSLPSGEIDERDDTPAGAQSKLPYPMQLGSGTVDLLPGVTYIGNSTQTSWGAQATGTLRLGENDNDYTLGDRFQGTVWGTYSVNQSLAPSVRLTWNQWGNIDGADPDLNPMMISTADPDLRGGSRLDLGLGTNLFINKGVLKGTRIGGEFQLPIRQELDGPQLEMDWSLTLGLHFEFK